MPSNHSPIVAQDSAECKGAAEKPRCQKCRKEIPEGAVYCPYCGRKQSGTETRKALKRANGMGTVYKLQGRRRRPWVAAKKKVILGYYETKTAALEALARMSQVDVTERYNWTFQQVFEAWQEEHYKTLTKAGIATYNRSFAVFAPLHNQKFRALRTADFQAVIDQHMGKTHSTVSKYKQLITQMSRWAIREEICTTNFATYVRIPGEKKKEKEIFSWEDIEKLRADGSETAMIILMLIYTGMRIGELFSLPLSGYHETYVIAGEKTEAGRNRVIPIHPAGRAYFAHFASTADPDADGLLISGYKGNRLVNGFRRRDYYNLLDVLGILRKSPHAARHTFASEARKAGMPPEVLQKILGHANYETTANIYVHTEITQLIAEVDATFVQASPTAPP